jgi:hypothetical protein
MSTNLPATRSDGFDTYTESVDGHEDRAASGGGVFLNFGLDAQWHRSTDKAVVTGTALVLMSLERRCVRRVMVDGKQRNEETQVISSGPWPDTDAWNAQLPAAEKVPDFNGNPTGPWFKEATLRFVDPDTLTKYTWTARLSTAGAAMCVRDIKDKVQYMRQFRPGATAVVELSTTPMRTKFGERPRPHLEVASWIQQGSSDDGDAVAALPAPQGPAGPAGAAEVVEATPIKAAKAAPRAKAAKVKATGTKSFFAPKTVTPPTLAEELNDEIPDLGR